MDDQLLGLIDRLGRLEGLLLGLQGTMAHGQTQVSGFVARVERLEQKQVELESKVVTREDMKELALKVDNLSLSISESKGGIGMAAYAINALIAAIAASAAVWGVMQIDGPTQPLPPPAAIAPPVDYGNRH